MNEYDETYIRERIMRKAYLGDGVYVEVEHGMLKLTAGNGIAIYLEPEVMVALIDYWKSATS